MQIKEILISIPLVIFIFWVFSAPLPQARIERVCEPIQWVGNLATSTTALSSERHTGTAMRWSDKLDYSCQYLIWRLFYQDDYNKALAEGRVKVNKDREVQVLEGDQKSEQGETPARDPQTGEIPGAETPKEKAPAVKDAPSAAVVESAPKAPAAAEEKPKTSGHRLSRQKEGTQ